MKTTTHPLRVPTRLEWWPLAGGVLALAALTAAFRVLLGVSNGTVVALSFLLVVLFVASVTTPRAAVAISILAVLTLNYSFLPPVGGFTIDDPENWVALFVFLVVSVVATRLSLRARQRTAEATARRDELGRLFDLSRDVLLTTDSRGALDVLARYVSRRFGLDYVAMCLREEHEWRLHESAAWAGVDRGDLDLALADARGALEFDADTCTYGGHRTARTTEGTNVSLTPIRIGTRAIGLLATAGRVVEPGTLDAVAGLAAIAIERATLLEERREAERTRQSAELKSALLASLSHDLQTPLTAITVACDNFGASRRDERQHREQLDIVTTEVARLNRLFQSIVAMARIDTGAVDAAREWVHTTDIVDAAVQQAEQALRDHPLDLHVNDDDVVQIDPRLTATAVAHLLENAGRYSPVGAAISVSAVTDETGVTMSVRVGARASHHQTSSACSNGSTAGQTPVIGPSAQAWGSPLREAYSRCRTAVCGPKLIQKGGAVFTLAIPTPTRDGALPHGASS